MIARNALLLGIMAPAALGSSLAPHAVMLLVCAAFAAANYRHRSSAALALGQSALELPFSLWTAFRYGMVFLVLHVIGILAQHHAGDSGVYVVSLIGGLVSSASAVAAAASLAVNGSVSPHAAGIAAIIASLTSVLVNLPFVIGARNRQLTAKLAVAMAAVAVAGLLAAWLA
jgi:uncharacterized membrane protein (DUF4010 family)